MTGDQELDACVKTTAETAARAAAPLAPAPVRAEDPLGLLTAALEYIEDRHWEIALGTYVQRVGDAWACSCGDSRCAA
ncbi:MAG: hypothetical protein ACRDSS_06645, partial [Actinocrinis sp.]